MEEVERPPFDINLAVILAGFAFEAYTTPAVCFVLLEKHDNLKFCYLHELRKFEFFVLVTPN